ncbi:hypothetical protein LOD99_2463 [Oopsacas minuta]|uniref:Uncharacterized protein n=1 Tax=Oopsacas minuta TaxID=111878 RepID=A0AAV7K3K4_9METZ|nr:hypothetical protein LOD99_2463 [Oopsacas minuta]
MQKGINSFGQNSNGIKRHNIGDHRVTFNICFPNGDTFEEDFYMKQPLAQQLTKIINEQRRQGSTFMKKKYYYHALHPVDLLIIDEDHKFIPNDRPPGNWPTIVKCIMQERKPLLYVWSFKFCEKDKVSFPDVAHMTEPKFFNKKPDQINQSEPTLLNLPIMRTNSICELSPQKIPIHFENSQR